MAVAWIPDFVQGSGESKLGRNTDKQNTDPEAPGTESAKWKMLEEKVLFPHFSHFPHVVVAVERKSEWWEWAQVESCLTAMSTRTDGAGGVDTTMYYCTCSLVADEEMRR